ncbi:hypothetical protein OG21DRAFT_1412470 [Imleria badia]|nr:hypothetical protein OG21DRAFT_1412470 [Imleria badia]
MSAELPTDPKAVKKMEKAVAKEAQADEMDYQRTLKELKRTEKSEVEASKAASKADKHLKKMEDKEHDTIKLLQKATHNRDWAVMDLHTAQSDVQVSLGFPLVNEMRRLLDSETASSEVKGNVDNLRVRADEIFQAKQIREVGVRLFASALCVDPRGA